MNDDKIALPEVINKKSLGKKEETKIISLLVKTAINGCNSKTLSMISLKGCVPVSVKVPEGNKWHTHVEQSNCLNRGANLHKCGQCLGKHKGLCSIQGLVT